MAVSPAVTPVQRGTITPVTDGSGDATAYSAYVTGILAKISYTKTDYSAGVDFTITVERDGQTIWTETNVDASTFRCPRCAVHDSAGAAITGGYSAIALHQDRIKVVIASGGATHTGAFDYLIFPAA